MEDCNPNYIIGDHVLHWSDETRDLGVIIDKKNLILTATSQPLPIKLIFEHP